MPVPWNVTPAISYRPPRAGKAHERRATIAIALRLLPELRALDAAQLRTLAANLRILSNVAEAWAYRNEKSSQTDDE